MPGASVLPAAQAACRLSASFPELCSALGLRDAGRGQPDASAPWLSPFPQSAPALGLLPPVPPCTRRSQVIHAALATPEWKSLAAAAGQRWRYVWLADSDVEVSACTLTRFFRNAEANQLLLAQVGAAGLMRQAGAGGATMDAARSHPAVPDCRASTTVARPAPLSCTRLAGRLWDRAGG